MNQDEAIDGFVLSQSTLAIDWLRPEEDQAWAHLQDDAPETNNDI